MKRVSIQIQSLPNNRSQNNYLIFPKPFDDWIEECTHTDFYNLRDVREIQASNYRQHAYLAKITDDNQLPTITYEFKPLASGKPANWFWEIQDNRYTTASPELIDETQALCAGLSSQQEKITTLIEHAADLFSYGHNDGRFNDGLDQVPGLCGITRGSCVDINTYLIAATRCLDIPVQYIIGYWFHPEKTETPDAHCWLAFLADGEVQYWDLAHHLKWGVPELKPDLNPAGGRRAPMSYGRGLQFNTPVGAIELSHFSEPKWLKPNGELERPSLKIQIED